MQWTELCPRDDETDNGYNQCRKREHCDLDEAQIDALDEAMFQYMKEEHNARMESDE